VRVSVYAQYLKYSRALEQIWKITKYCGTRVSSESHYNWHRAACHTGFYSLGVAWAPNERGGRNRCGVEITNIRC
jgi:hypothetical protein